LNGNMPSKPSEVQVFSLQFHAAFAITNRGDQSSTLTNIGKK